ncbi:unnamed protein product [Heligmosomoides polygyrus]|uniref:Retrotransposon protein n=1 Tax=Heligmosomoides polygyrus TaxID=6339 RepID=A0A183G7Y3_HELPZ|nr:unnamed protein product [Heligmosomoides polygyrus]
MKSVTTLKMTSELFSPPSRRISTPEKFEVLWNVDGEYSMLMEIIWLINKMLIKNVEPFSCTFSISSCFRYDERWQRPKTKKQIMTRYGFDIREGDTQEEVEGVQRKRSDEVGQLRCFETYRAASREHDRTETKKIHEERKNYICLRRGCKQAKLCALVTMLDLAYNMSDGGQRAACGVMRSPHHARSWL